MSKKLTLEEIGKIAGVSRSTVSRVVNNHVNVKPEVRQRVLGVIAETGYRPNPAARSLAGQRAHVIGLVVTEMAQSLFIDPYYPLLIQGVTQACNSFDYTLSLFLFHSLEDKERLTTRLLQSNMLDGLIITATYTNDPLIERLVSSRIPFVLVGYHDNPRVNFVDADNYAGAYNAVSHLIRSGRKRIASITGMMRNLASQHRLNGYKDALRDRGLHVDENLIVDGGFTEAGGYKAAETLLQHDFDALFAASDAMALGAMRAFRAAGRCIPEDVAIVGFDDLPLSASTEPPLTTVRQPVKQAGGLAVETLLDLLENGPDPARRIVLPTELVVRRS